MFQTEFEFSLPRGYVDKDGRVHREGAMRLATAADEILPLKDPRVQGNPAYLVVILLARVVTRLGELEVVNPKVIEELFAADLAYLQDFYNRINGNGADGARRDLPALRRRLRGRAGDAAGGILGYPLDRAVEEVAYVAYHFHWPHEQLMTMEHAERRRWVRGDRQAERAGGGRSAAAPERAAVTGGPDLASAPLARAVLARWSWRPAGVQGTQRLLGGLAAQRAPMLARARGLQAWHDGLAHRWRPADIVPPALTVGGAGPVSADGIAAPRRPDRWRRHGPRITRAARRSDPERERPRPSGAGADRPGSRCGIANRSACRRRRPLPLARR